MSETARIPQKGVPTDELPLAVLLFHAAMEKGVPLNQFAEQIGINTLSLRQFINGQTQRPRSKTLELLAQALERPLADVRWLITLRPTAAPPFAEWLQARMEAGQFSRARLTRETSISDGALRNYLNNRTLPDTDQAQRLAEVLHVNPQEMARVLVANSTVRAGGETLPAPPEEAADHDGLNGEHNGEHGPLDNTYPEGLRPLSALDGSLLSDEELRLLALWRRLHPQGRRATVTYIAGLLAEV